MKQIKTIYKKSPSEFDNNVNEALQDGWKLMRRTFDDGGFIAELEKNVVTEKEITDEIPRICETCIHNGNPLYAYPCGGCKEMVTVSRSEWEAVE